MRRTRATFSRKFASALLVAILLFLARTAAAAERRVALVGGDVGLRHALEIALATWGIQVVDVQDAPPVSFSPGVNDDARGIAVHAGAGAVVWVSEDRGGAALWMYDAEGDQLASRRLGAPPPFDTATAAAAALSIKTLLRGSSVAPKEEREGRRGGEAPLLRAEVAGGIRLPPGSATLEPRLGVAASFWPGGGMMGAALAVRAGPGIVVSGRDLDARLVDTTMAAHARLRAKLSRWFSFEPALGFALHIVSFDGSVPSLLVPFSERRVNPAVEVRASLGLQVGGGVRLGFEMGAAYLGRRQRYLVLGDPIYELSSLEVDATLGVGLEFL